jgi:hypothetical protein
MKSIISNILVNSGYALQREANLALKMGLKRSLVAHYKSVTTSKLML